MLEFLKKKITDIEPDINWNKATMTLEKALRKIRFYKKENTLLFLKVKSLSENLEQKDAMLRIIEKEMEEYIKNPKNLNPN